MVEAKKDKKSFQRKRGWHGGTKINFRSGGFSKGYTQF